MKIPAVKQGSLLPTVFTLLPSLTKAERKVAETLLKKPQDVLYCSITEFSEMSKVHDTTVVRFCRKLGLRGYQEFKMILAQETAVNDIHNTDILENEVRAEDSISLVKQKLLQINHAALQDTAVILDDSSVERAVDAIQKARRVVFFGVGSSGNIAQDAMDRFMRIGVMTQSYIDSHLQAMCASLMSPEDVAVAISHSGSTIDTADTLAIARNTGATTICITHYAKSPITHHANIILLSGHQESPLQGGAVSTKIAQLFVIDVLYTTYTKNNYQAIQDKKARSTNAVTGRLY